MPVELCPCRDERSPRYIHVAHSFPEGRFVATSLSSDCFESLYGVHVDPNVSVQT